MSHAPKTTLHSSRRAKVYLADPSSPNLDWPLQLGIGELIITGGETSLITVLGSCLALMASAPSFGVSGMVHAIYPSRSNRPMPFDESSLRYVDESFHKLVSEFARLGVPRRELSFKLFGGATLMLRTPNGARIPSPGDANLKVARRWIAEEGISLSGEDVGGPFARRLVLEPRTGEVLVQLLRSGFETPTTNRGF